MLMWRILDVGRSAASGSLSILGQVPGFALFACMSLCGRSAVLVRKEEGQYSSSYQVADVAGQRPSLEGKQHGIQRTDSAQDMD
jgi:hypothetical protein